MSNSGHSKHFFFLLLFFLLSSCTMYQNHSISLEDCQETLEWIKLQNISQDSLHTLILPKNLGKLTSDNRVYVVKESEDTFYALFKTEITWKDNFIGTFFASKKLEDRFIFQLPDNKNYISLEKYHMFQELYIRKKFDDFRYLVYFDLN